MAFLIKEYFKGDLSCNFWACAFKNLTQSFLNFNFISLETWSDFKFSLVAVPSFISSGGRHVSFFVKSSLISLYCVLAFSIMSDKTSTFIILLMTFSNKLDKNAIQGLSDWNETKNSWNKDAINLKKCNLAVTVISKWCLINISYDLLSLAFY